jgi:hypothetical protein
MRIADGGGSSDTIVLNPDDLRKTAALLGAAAQEDGVLAKQVGGHGLPDMPGDVAARVQTVMNEVSSGLGSEPKILIESGRELRARALWGDIADKLAAGYDLSDSELNEFKATMHDGSLLKYADDPFYVQLANDYAKKVHDREHPGGIMGFLKDVGHGLADFAEGAWDAIKDPALMLYHLSPLSSNWTHSWEQLGKGLEYAAEHPLEFGKAVINLDALEKRGVAYWLGNLAPAAIATVMSGGGAAALRGVGATDRVMEGATALDRAAAGAEDLSRFAPAERQFFKEVTEFEGSKVYQRSDLIDPALVDDRGRTNIERMQKGLAPLGPDGKSVNLHHMLQTQDGPIAELTQTFHKTNHKVIHINPSSIPSGIDRSTFDAWRSRYWMNRAGDFTEGP